MADTIGKLGEKLIPLDLQERKELWHERSFAGRKGSRAIDSVMLMDQLSQEDGKHVYGRDIHSAFNSIDTQMMVHRLRDSSDQHVWVRDFLALRPFQLRTDSVIGEATMTGRTPKGRP